MGQNGVMSVCQKTISSEKVLKNNFDKENKQTMKKHKRNECSFEQKYGINLVCSAREEKNWNAKTSVFCSTFVCFCRKSDEISKTGRVLAGTIVTYNCPSEVVCIQTHLA
jgi:hypothetical protein